VKAIKKITGLKTSIKWPNDVHFKKKKLCGILTESVLGKKNIAVVGIGLNVNQKKFPREIRNTAASLRIIKHRFYNIKTIMSEILREFFSLYEGFYAKNKLDYVAKLWKKHCDTTGKEIIVLAKGKRLYGKALGIGKDCSLLLKLKNETIIKIVEGDVRIRY
jgi:BirA family biotin operon repressor/biotin-[acetyl-CoA-carboxylase] ligase